MIKYEYINKEWIVSPTARRVYRIAAVVSLTIYFTLAAILVNGPTPLLKQLLFVGVVATAIIIVGMEFFLFRVDDSRGWIQIFWFCVMLFPPVGPALYCLLVYSGSKAVRNALAARSEDVSSAVK